MDPSVSQWGTVWKRTTIFILRDDITVHNINWIGQVRRDRAQDRFIADSREQAVKAVPLSLHCSSAQEVIPDAAMTVILKFWMRLLTACSRDSEEEPFEMPSDRVTMAGCCACNATQSRAATTLLTVPADRTSHDGNSTCHILLGMPKRYQLRERYDMHLLGIMPAMRMHANDISECSCLDPPIFQDGCEYKIP